MGAASASTLFGGGRAGGGAGGGAGAGSSTGTTSAVAASVGKRVEVCCCQLECDTSLCTLYVQELHMQARQLQLPLPSLLQLMVL